MECVQLPGMRRVGLAPLDHDGPTVSPDPGSHRAPRGTATDVCEDSPHHLGLVDGPDPRADHDRDLGTPSFSPSTNW